jgi:hypothetical protein
MDETDYKNLINDIIVKQIQILGKDLVLIKTRKVRGLQINSDGQVENISAAPEEALQNLIDEFSDFLGPIEKKIVAPLMQKYPSIKIPLV